MKSSPLGGSRDAQPARGSPQAAVAAFDLEAAVLAFAVDAACASLELPPALCAKQRKRAKDLAGQHHGLRCESFGFGPERRLHLFKNIPGQKSSDGASVSLGQEAGLATLQEFTFGHSDALDLPNKGSKREDAGTRPGVSVAAATAGGYATLEI